MPQSKNKKPDFSNADMTVYEVQDERPSLPLPRPINPVLPDIPGILLFLTKCKSGKSNMIANLLNREEYYEGIFDKIIIVLLFISLGGIPPLLGFLRKFLILKIIFIYENLILFLIIIFSSLVLLYHYISRMYFFITFIPSLKINFSINNHSTFKYLYLISIIMFQGIFFIL